MARATMADLIARLRTLAGDPAGADQVFSDDDYQYWLDNHRYEIRYHMLDPLPTIGPGGTVAYLDFASCFGWWESDVQLVDSSYRTVTPDSAEMFVGRWHFNAAQVPPLYLIGRHYDGYGAAADALDAWAAKLGTDVDFAAGNNQVKLSQAVRQLAERATTYRRQQMVGTVRMTRDDLTTAPYGWTYNRW